MASSFDAQALLIKRLRDQRLRWVDLGAGLRVQVLTLRETELPQLRTREVVDIVCDQAVDWSGFTEATLLGAHDGSSDPLPFTAEVWAEVARNSMVHTTAVADVLVADAQRVLQQRADARKN